MSRTGLSMFIVAGRTGHSLIAAKSLPFSFLDDVREIRIFSETAGFDIPKCSYIVIPDWIRKIRPVFLGRVFRFIFEPLQLLYYSVKLKPYFINGIYCLPKGLNSYVVSRLTGVKCVNSVIGSILEVETELYFRKIWRSINLWHLRGCEAVTIKGETDRNYLGSKGIDQIRMFPFNGAVDTAKFLWSDDDRNTDILYVGSFIELKGIDRIIIIVQKLLHDFPGLKVVMAGDGKLLEKTKKRVRELDIQNSVSFEGFRKETVDYFRQSKILLMPSRSDSLPTAMLEAMACGCVPVISNVGNVTEAAHHNINAKVIDDYMDTDCFADSIRDLLSDEKMRYEYALNGRKTVEDHYSVKSQAVNAGKIIEHLTNN